MESDSHSLSPGSDHCSIHSSIVSSDWQQLCRASGKILSWLYLEMLGILSSIGFRCLKTGAICKQSMGSPTQLWSSLSQSAPEVSKLLHYCDKHSTSCTTHARGRFREASSVQSSEISSYQPGHIWFCLTVAAK